MAVEQVPSRFAVPLSVLLAGAQVPLAQQVESVESRPAPPPLSRGAAVAWGGGAHGAALTTDGDGD